MSFLVKHKNFLVDLFFSSPPSLSSPSFVVAGGEGALADED